MKPKPANGGGMRQVTAYRPRLLNGALGALRDKHAQNRFSPSR